MMSQRFPSCDVNVRPLLGSEGLVALMCDTKRLRGGGACGSNHQKSEMCAFKSGGANWFFAGLQGCPRTQGGTQGWMTPVRMGD